jgi:hypothetical protein
MPAWQQSPPGRITPPPAAATTPPRSQLSPQQVLLGLGGLLVVAAAIAFVAVAWTRLGLVFQAGVMLTVTSLMCGFSAWTARKGLRATEETLAAAGAALLVVDLTAARALGLFGLEDVALRTWTTWSATVVVLVALALGRGTRSTMVWPLTALLAAQPLPFLLLPDGAVSGPAGVAAALAVAGADVVAAARLRRAVRPVALVLVACSTALAVVGGLEVAVYNGAVESWTATGLLLLGGAAALVLTRVPRPALLPRPEIVGGFAAAVGALSVTASLQTIGDPGAVVATAAGLVALSVAVPLARHRTTTAVLVSAGATAALTGSAVLLDDFRLRPLALLVLGATVPAVLAAWRLPALRAAATGAAILAPAAAVLLARADAWLTAPVAGLLLALLAAAAFAVAAARAERPEERVAALGGALAGLAAGMTTAAVGAWGQVAVALVPSALVVVAEPTALRLILVVAGAVVLTVTGTLAHRQAPFVLGAGALLFVVVGRLAPYAPLLPRWVTLATAGLVLLVVGATYERRRQQAREAVAWVAQMR